MEFRHLLRDMEIDSPVKRAGNIRITQKLVPRAAWIDDIPRRAISEDVSKPRPNRTPRGYIFHGLFKFQLSSITREVSDA